MCGIAGVVSLNGGDPARGVAATMRDLLLHRGPDGSGEHDGPGISLAACRLAIVDLEPRGLMPMASADGRRLIAFNGEIYNRPELRAELLAAGVELRTTTDTEVVLELFAREGAQMLDRLDGMFAFAIWDAEARELFAARDRVGEKPFFYAEHDGGLLFASEPKALFAAGLPAAFADETWLELMTFRGVAGERTPYRGVRSLLPGHWLRVREGRIATGEWWRFPSRGARPDPDSFGPLFEASVRRRLVADVPVGTLLSGGLDSSAVTAVAAALSQRRLPAFTVRYDGTPLDEGEHAAAVAERAGVEHHHVRIDPSDRPQLLADATWHLDAPIDFLATADILAVSRYARQHVRVLLTGETSDELFGGYARLRLYRHQRLVELIGRLLAPHIDRLRYGSRWYRIASASRLSREDWIAATYADGNPLRFTDRPLAEWAPYRAQAAAAVVAEHREPVGQALAYERLTHLPAIVATGDRMTMAAGIEARLPFTDPALLELAGLAWPGDLFRGRQGKQPLRAAMAGRLPETVLRRRKQGWSSPFMGYLRDDPRLRAWLRDVPEHETVAHSPMGTAGARRVVEGFLAGDSVRARDVWMLARIVLWHQVCIEGSREPFGAATRPTARPAPAEAAA
jgi:asparagine synthase (glutamine-hydrolysing)